jgi:hypothetical protein
LKFFYNRLYTNIKKLKKTKSCENFLNSSNTLNQFFTKDEVYVTKLKFFEPGKFNIYNSFDENENLNHKKNKENISLINKTLLQKKSLNNKIKFIYKNEDNKEEITRETIFENKLKELNEKLNNLKKEIKEQITKVLLIENNIEDSNLEYKAIEQQSQFIPFEEKCRKLNINISIITNEEIYQLKNKIFQNANKAKKLLKPKQNEIDDLKNKYIEEKKILDEKISQFKIIKSQYSDNKKRLIFKYHKLIEKGRDPEGKGLSNLIEKIWKLKSEIIFSFFPKFLDCKSIDYLFTYAKLKIDKDKAIDKLNNFINKIYENNADHHNKKENIISKNIINEIIEDYENKFKEIENWKKITCDKIEKFLKYDNDLFKDISENLNIIKKLRNSVEKIMSLMNLLKRKEIERIKNEFIDFDYQRRFDVDIKTVFVALFGDEKAESEFVKYETEIKFPLIRQKIFK